MDDFNLDDYLELLPDAEPKAPAFDFKQFLKPAGADWAEYEYNYGWMCNREHLFALAYYVSHVACKYVASIDNWVLELTTHVGKQTLWLKKRDSDKEDKNFKDITGKLGFVIEIDYEPQEKSGHWILLRQTIDYDKFKTCQIMGFYKSSTEVYPNSYLWSKQTWEAKQASDKERHRLRYRDRSGWGDDYPDGHPYDYGDS